MVDMLVQKIGYDARFTQGKKIPSNIIRNVRLVRELMEVYVTLGDEETANEILHNHIESIVYDISNPHERAMLLSELLKYCGKYNQTAIDEIRDVCNHVPKSFLHLEIKICLAEIESLKDIKASEKMLKSITAEIKNTLMDYEVRPYMCRIAKAYGYLYTITSKDTYTQEAKKLLNEMKDDVIYYILGIASLTEGITKYVHPKLSDLLRLKSMSSRV